MIIYHHPNEVPTGFGPSVIAIGKFDGVHAGHRAVIERARERAQSLGAQTVAVTFDRNPLALLRPELCPEDLVGPERKLHLLAEAGADATLLLRFDRELASLPAETFVQQYLVQPFQAVSVLVGKDFRFGRSGSGTPELLAESGRRHGFTVDVIADVTADQRRVSSTWIREVLSAGDVAAAADQLGREHSVEGVVVQGHKRGRELGFPTANLGDELTGFVPADGVYAGWLIDPAPGAADGDGIHYPAAISIGTNPTFTDVPTRQIEAYVLDETALDLYGHHVQVCFTERIRGMVAFESIDALVAQMNKDVAHVREVLASD